MGVGRCSGSYVLGKSAETHVLEVTWFIKDGVGLEPDFVFRAVDPDIHVAHACGEMMK